MGKSNWGENPAETPDAISGATPFLGIRELRFEWKKKFYTAGKYRYMIEVNLDGEYNLIYSGEIGIGEGPDESEAKIENIPDSAEGATELLTDVKVIFQ